MCLMNGERTKQEKKTLEYVIGITYNGESFSTSVLEKFIYLFAADVCLSIQKALHVSQECKY